MTPQSAKSSYRHSFTLDDYWNQRVVKHSGYYDYDCWQFKTKGDKDGYPQVQGSPLCRKAGVTRAHQLSYLIHKGQIPENKIVCHTCDHPWCVNPDHLFLGDWNDNVQDMMRKGRYVHPTSYGKAMKLTRNEKEEILTRKGKQRSVDVADEFNISFSRVCQIWRGE